MPYSHLPGNDLVKNYLCRLADAKVAGASILFAGPSAAAFARAFGQELLKTEAKHHPDFFIYRPEGKVGLHSIDSMRALSKEVYLPPTSSYLKLFLVEEADRMVSFSANALLKTLEEPADTSLILLASEAPEALLPTIRSRCRTLHLQPAGEAVGDSVISERAIAYLARPTNDFRKITAAAEELGKALEAKRPTVTVPDDLTPSQKERYVKEAEGVATRAYLTEVDHLLTTILFWFRDLYIVAETGRVEAVHHRSHIKELIDSGITVNLPKVEQAIIAIRTSIARHTKPAQALESLFLQLQAVAR